MKTQDKRDLFLSVAFTTILVTFIIGGIQLIQGENNLGYFSISLSAIAIFFLIKQWFKEERLQDHLRSLD